MPMLQERLNCLREAGKVLYEKYACSFANCIAAANQSAAALVNLLVQDFPCLRDEHHFEGRTVHIYKRAQILVADIWACFNEESYGTFHDIETITMFADYRIPQMLHSLGCLMFSPPLESRIRRQEMMQSGEKCELELRGCSIWAVEMIRRQILKHHPGAKVNSVLIDTFLYDSLKEKEAAGGITEMIPHHRTRSIWY
jgi:Potential Queuosine, Q, salvage protein family